MKKLKKMKNFSSLENKMLKDLKAVQGGIVAGSSHSAASNAGGNSDTDHYSDASPGVWTFDYRTWNI
ncbi:grasp-with-spasm system A modified peptide [Epilithonimonas vandammei]|uniref:Grasp-with-spasm system A modified peptide n=1 Tax=Epilithonimonas vandammei TaxID=2487072 RepID=A0A3G8ZEJ5_9FLAO|nr:grasp-with-spasm system A modified peptide [Epilithonimonas vandammei]AZI55205.1 grasp-with-spasm system A modified peptide [Epilithonimonas vandammei]